MFLSFKLITQPPTHLLTYFRQIFVAVAVHDTSLAHLQVDIPAAFLTFQVALAQTYPVVASFPAARDQT